MKPTSELVRRKKRHLTARQLARRMNMPVDKSSENVNKYTEMKFASNSKLWTTPQKVFIEIDTNDLSDVTGFDLDKMITLYKRTVLDSKNTNLVSSIYDLISARPGMIHFALFMNNIGHYSGGRYYLVYIAYLLANMGHKVTVITDKMPLFLKDFRYIEIGDRLEWICDKQTRKTKWFLNSSNNEFDIILESPLASAGFLYANKWRVPLYAILFESPNYVAKYRDGDDSTEDYWRPYKQGILSTSNKLICISEVGSNYAKDWLKGYRGNIEVVQPCINTWIADRVKQPERENEITFVGRHVEFKNPSDIIHAVSKIPRKIRPDINFVGSHSSKLRVSMVNSAENLDVNIRFYANVTDDEKFYLIKRSKLLIFPSLFEGFGIPPAEAIYCGVPVIAYDIPVLKREYGNSIDYVEPNNINAIRDKIEYYLTKSSVLRKRSKSVQKCFYKKENAIPCLPSTMKNKLRDVIYQGKDLSITAGMIALNASDTILLTLKSVYDYVDKIVLVEGAVEDYARVNPEMVKLDGFFNSVDNTQEIYNDFKENHDPFDKLEIVLHPQGRFWKNKSEMQNEIAKRVNTDLYLKVDSDELYIESDVEYMKRQFMNDKDLRVIQILKHEFWKSLKMVAVGGQWSRPQARMWRWSKDFRHSEEEKAGFNYFIDSKGLKVKPPNYKTLNLMEKLCYHLGYLGNDDKIRSKIRYYANRGIEHDVVDNFSNWSPGRPTNCTHPAGTKAEEFQGELPFILQEWYFKNIIVSSNLEQRLDNNINMMRSLPKKSKHKKGQ